MKTLSRFSYGCLVVASVLWLALWFSGGIIVAQETAKNSVAATPTPAPEVKPKPIILTKADQLKYENLQLKIRNAQLEMEALIPQKLKDNFKAANDELTAFWANLGASPAIEYDKSDGVDGAIILTPKVKKDVAPAGKKP